MGPWGLDYVPKNIWAIQIVLGVCFSLGDGHKGGRVELGGIGSECDWASLWETPEESLKILCWKKKRCKWNKKYSGHQGDFTNESQPNNMLTIQAFTESLDMFIIYVSHDRQTPGTQKKMKSNEWPMKKLQRDVAQDRDSSLRTKVWRKLEDVFQEKGLNITSPHRLGVGSRTEL